MGASQLRRGEHFAAHRSFLRAARIAETPDDRELARGLVHLAAAGHKLRLGDRRGNERQLTHARRRLGPHLPEAHRVDLAGLLDLARG